MNKLLEVKNPATGEVLETLPLKDEREIREMVARAKKAQIEWARRPLFERGALLYKFMDKITENARLIGEITAREMAKPVSQGAAEPIDAADIGRGYVERAKHLYGDVFCETVPGLEADLLFTKREPLGVVACVIPFNFPPEMVIQKVVPALIMGNTAIVKAPSSNPLNVKKVVALAHEAGIPKDAIQFLAAEREDATKGLLENEDIAAISLTGSTEAGKNMMAAASATLKHLFLELGGNDATIILADADLDYAVSDVIGGRIMNMGQTCCANKRMLVHRSIAGVFAEKLTEGLKALKRGDALDPETDLTCLVSEGAAVKVERQIQRTLEQGAKLFYGGEREGAYIPPTVLTDVPASADIAGDMEVFGPVFPIIPFDTEAEAVEIANNTQYGLSSGIITKDTFKAMNLACRIDAGAVVLNGQSNYRHMDQPFGGHKMSGIGNEGVASSLEEYSTLKTYIVKEAFPIYG